MKKVPRTSVPECLVSSFWNSRFSLPLSIRCLFPMSKVKPIYKMKKNIKGHKAAKKKDEYKGNTKNFYHIVRFSSSSFTARSYMCSCPFPLWDLFNNKRDLSIIHVLGSVSHIANYLVCNLWDCRLALHAVSQNTRCPKTFFVNIIWKQRRLILAFFHLLLLCHLRITRFLRKRRSCESGKVLNYVSEARNTRMCWVSSFFVFFILFKVEFKITRKEWKSYRRKETEKSDVLKKNCIHKLGIGRRTGRSDKDRKSTLLPLTRTHFD